jgi:flavin-dependent dehydrogenase
VCGCCIGGAGLETLARLSQRSWVVQRGEETHRWKSSIGGKLVQLDLPAGVAISRQLLDQRLIQQASEAGAKVMMGCRASIVSADESSATIDLVRDTDRRRQQFAAVVVASGLNMSGLQNILPWTTSPHGPFGAAFHAACPSLESGVIYMACDDDGYVGLVRLENGRVDVAAALSSGSDAASRGTPQERIASILDRSMFPAWDFDDRSPVITTPPLRRTRLAGNGRVLAIGDAAGYVEPFTGEGMTWGMQSGIAAAELIAASMGDLSTAGQKWNREIQQLLWSKKMACRAVTTTLRLPWARRAVAGLLASCPSLATPLVRRLNRS